MAKVMVAHPTKHTGPLEIDGQNAPQPLWDECGGGHDEANHREGWGSISAGFRGGGGGWVGGVGGKVGGGRNRALNMWNN